MGEHIIEFTVIIIHTSLFTVYGYDYKKHGAEGNKLMFLHSSSS